jgi:hypothetical protein
MLNLEDGTEEEYDNKPGCLIESPTPSNPNITRAIHLILPAMEMDKTLELLLPTQDGGKCSGTNPDGL